MLYYLEVKYIHNIDISVNGFSQKFREPNVFIKQIDFTKYFLCPYCVKKYFVKTAKEVNSTYMIQLISRKIAIRSQKMSMHSRESTTLV